MLSKLYFVTSKGLFAWNGFQVLIKSGLGMDMVTTLVLFINFVHGIKSYMCFMQQNYKCYKIVMLNMGFEIMSSWFSQKNLSFLLIIFVCQMLCVIWNVLCLLDSYSQHVVFYFATWVFTLFKEKYPNFLM